MRSLLRQFPTASGYERSHRALPAFPSCIAFRFELGVWSHKIAPRACRSRRIRVALRAATASHVLRHSEMEKSPQNLVPYCARTKPISRKCGKRWKRKCLFLQRLLKEQVDILYYGKCSQGVNATSGLPDPVMGIWSSSAGGLRHVTISLNRLRGSEVCFVLETDVCRCRRSHGYAL